MVPRAELELWVHISGRKTPKRWLGSLISGYRLSNPEVKCEGSWEALLDS